MAEVVPAELTDEPTCTHQSGFRIRVWGGDQIDSEHSDKMKSALTGRKPKGTKHEMVAAKSLFWCRVAMVAQLLCCRKPWSVMIMWGSNNCN